MHSATSLMNVHAQIRNCMSCRLCSTRTQAVPGEGPIPAEIMFVGEAPGHVNDQLGRPFVGHGGKIFDTILNRVGIRREDVFVTNAVKCWPPENRKPKLDELAACRAYLDEQITAVRPRIIFALGTASFSLLTGEPVKLRSEHGKIVHRGETVVCALFHPNGLRYIKGGRDTLVQVLSATLQRVYGTWNSPSEPIAPNFT
jgi:uracil-DNA glycosylase family 4